MTNQPQETQPSEADRSHPTLTVSEGSEVRSTADAEAEPDPDPPPASFPSATTPRSLLPEVVRPNLPGDVEACGGLEGLCGMDDAELPAELSLAILSATLERFVEGPAARERQTTMDKKVDGYASSEVWLPEKQEERQQYALYVLRRVDRASSAVSNVVEGLKHTVYAIVLS